MKYLSTALVLSIALAAGCTSDKDGPPTTDDTGVGDDTGVVVDEDGDGFPAADDCDDNDASVNPGATEVCDGVDNNCDAQVDEGVTTTYYQDYDGDGFGDDNQTVDACEPPSGYSLVGNDCDDGEAASYPGNTEICDGIDNNCDGQTDEGVGTTFYADSDTDGYGDPDSAIVACTQPTGYVTDNTDCDDTNIYAYPGSSEVCDEADNDCDLNVDEGVTTTYWIDLDADNYGDSGGPTQACARPTGYASVDGDCDDGEPLANPGETEVCDSIDNNCDGTVDEDSAADASTWYADADHDSYGNASVSTRSCDQPSGYVADNTDCNDSEGASYPGNTEVCDSIDNNCDGTVDEDSAVDAGTWYADSDSDTYGNASVSTQSCTQPSGYVTDSSDCDDSDATSFPGGTEVCDSADNDCNGLVDDNPTDGDTFYLDSDSDTFGDPNNTTVECTLPSGYADNSLDCDDGDANEPVVVDARNGTTSGSGSSADPMFYLQDAIDTANVCVLALRGTYREAIDLSSTDITVFSEEGSDVTTIDPGYATCSAASLASGTCTTYAPAVTIAGGGGSTPMLQGFTISGGTGAAEYSSTSTTCADSSVSHAGTNSCTVEVYEFCGGGIYIDGDDPTFDDVVVEDNTLPIFEQYKVPNGDYEQVWVYSYGGGICALNTNSSFSGVVVDNNFADQGGGLYFSDGATATFTQSRIVGNTATDGAGIFLDNGSVNLTSSLLVFNEADTDGGGVFQQTAGVVSFFNVTAAGNESSTSGTARGDVIYSGTSTTANVMNSIFQGHQVNALAYGSGATTSSAYTDWYNSASGSTYGTGWSAGTGDINGDPRFTSFSDDNNTNNDNYHLRSTSPAVDAGNPASSYNDADGTPNDMGAYGGPMGSW